MRRRSFVKKSLITTALGAASSKISMASEHFKTSGREFYELRTYSLKNDAQQQLGISKNSAVAINII